MEGEAGVSEVLKDRLMWFAGRLCVIRTPSQSILSSHLPIPGICCLTLLLPQPAESLPGQVTGLQRQIQAPIWPSAEGAPEVSVLGLSEARAHPTPQRLSLRGLKTQGLGIRGATDPTQARLPETRSDSSSILPPPAAEPQSC